VAVTTWYFVADEEGQLARVPLARMDRFFDGTEVLPHVNTAVRAVEVTLTARGRKVVRVHRVLWLRLPVDARGHCDQEARQRYAALAMHSTSLVDHDASIVPLGPAIAGRDIQTKHAWRPTGEQRAVVASDLNSTAERPPVVIESGGSLQPV